MRLGTIVMFVLALVFGGGAVIFANAWLSSQVPAPGVQQQVAAQAPIETQTIVVAAKDLSFGEALTVEKLKEIPWARSDVPEGAFSKIAELTADGRRVSLTSISSNETILKWKISGAGGRASLSTTVTEGMRAVAVRVDDVVGVGGFVQPGDRVDLLYTRSANGDQSATNDVIVQNVRVLAIDQVADEKNEKPVVARVVTVEVQTVDAQKVALAQTTGSIMLSLRSAGSLDNAVPQRVVEQELVSNPSVYLAKLEQRDAAQEALEKRLDSVISESESSKKTMDERLAAIQSKLQGEIKTAGKDSKALQDKFKLLEQAVAASDGKSSAELRKRLAEFEASLKGMSATPAVAGQTTVIEPAAIKLTTTVGVTRGLKRETVEVVSEGAEAEAGE
jgi:pilus assembly protein CpaB